MKVVKHNIKSLLESLKNKKLDHIVVPIKIDEILSKVTLLDKDFGNYSVDLKCFCPGTKFPLHPKRKKEKKFNKIKKKYINQNINDLVITDVFYGPEKGYKNRSFYVEYKCKNNHIGINTYAGLTKHKKTFGCGTCDRTLHGERTRIDGVLKKRTPTYNYWQRIKKTLPEKYQEYNTFKKEIGDKPFKRAKLIIDNDKLYWINLQTVEDYELNLIATALRQAFRYSSIYKNIIEESKIETVEGTRYKCNKCKELFKYSEIQVDHINPIKSLDGTLLTKENMFQIIWTDKVQVLDKKCHAKKTTSENKLRKQLKQVDN